MAAVLAPVPASAPAGDPIFVIEVAGTQYECREHSYSANVTRLADSGTITIPAPDGFVVSRAGLVPVGTACPRGALCTLYCSDPAVSGGALLPRLRGRVVRRHIGAGADGTELRLCIADLGWHLSSCGRVFKNLEGVTWSTLLASQVLDPALGWGFAGIRSDNDLNVGFKLGRQGAEAYRQRQLDPKALIRFQIEVGQTLDSLLVQYARINKWLVNVSVDGYLQFFQPSYKRPALYTFIRRRPPHAGANNIISASLDETAETYTHVECWSTIVVRNKETNAKAQVDPNAGRYHGEYPKKGQRGFTAPLPFYRSYTFSDTEQMGRDQVDARARWQWQRFEFDAWSYQVEVKGHSQNGHPFVEDTMCEVHDEILGVDGLFYVSAVDCRRRIARGGFDRSAGTRATLTLNRPNLLGA